MQGRPYREAMQGGPYMGGKGTALNTFSELQVFDRFNCFSIRTLPKMKRGK